MPGKYKVSFAKRVNGVMTPLSAPQEFTVTVEGLSGMSSEDRVALVEFQQKVGRSPACSQRCARNRQLAQTASCAYQTRMLDTPGASDKLLDDAATLDKRTKRNSALPARRRYFTQPKRKHRAVSRRPRIEQSSAHNECQQRVRHARK
jgi:hypothetical protein